MNLPSASFGLAVFGILLFSATCFGQTPNHVAIGSTAEISIEVKRYTYKHSAGQPRDLEVHFPKGHDTANAKVPCVVLFHGGAWGGGDLKQFQEFCHYFASRGLVAITANYQLVSAKQKLPKGVSRKQFCITDAKSAIRWVKQHSEELGIDPMKVITGGGSAGGHISMLATTNPGLNDPADPKEIDTSVAAYLLFNPALAAFDAKFPEVDATQHLTDDLAPAIVFFGTEDKKWLAGWNTAHAQLKNLGAGDRIKLWLAQDAGHSFFSKKPWLNHVLIKTDRFLVSQGLLSGQTTLKMTPDDKRLIKAEEIDSSHQVEKEFTQQRAPDGRSPNILFIHMEDMGVQIPAYGDHTVETPNLDRLATQGIVFERAHVVAATCAASRGALFSGLHPHQNGIMGFIDSHGFHYRQGLTTFVHALKGKGYECGLTYKTGVTPNPPFDFMPSYKQNRLSGENNDHLVSNSIDNFRHFLQHLDEETPFYFQAQTPDTHSKWHRPKFIKPGSTGWPYPDVDEAKIKPFAWLGDDFLMNEKLRHEIGTYYRAIQRVDWYVGKILALLDEFDRADNTLVIFSSDHGPSHLLRGKTTPYEGGLQVPLIVRWPGVVKTPGTRSSALVSFVDLSPTFQAAAGITPPSYLPGHSLISVFKGEPAKRKYLFSSYVAHTTNQGSYWPTRTITDGRHKLIHNLNGNGSQRRTPEGYNNTSFLLAKTLREMPTGSVSRQVADRTMAPTEFELYDLQSDPGEIKNQFDHPEKATIQESLRKQLSKWQESVVDDPFRDPQYLASFNADYTQRLSQYEQKRQQMPASKIKKSKWKVNWDHRIKPWDPKPYQHSKANSR